jgi:hypothetical protein
MKGIIMQILAASKKDSFFIGTALIVLAICIFSFFVGSAALVENQEMKIAYVAGFGRISAVIGMMIFITFYIKRLFENKEIDVILSRPISRVSIVVAMIVGFYLLFLITLIPISIVLLLILKVKIISSLVWLLTVALEGFVVCCASLFFGLFIQSSVHTMIMCFAFYLLARGVGSFVAYIELGLSTSTYQMAASTLKICSIFIPRLDLFGKTSILLYNDYALNSILICIAQALVFGGLLSFGSIFEFRKKQF